MKTQSTKTLGQLDNNTAGEGEVIRNKPIISYEEFNEKASKLRTLSDITNFTRDLLAPNVQRMLDAEMDHHLGYPKNNISGNLSGNSRNGYYPKRVKTTSGDIAVRIPRDRNGDFTPQVVRKYETIESDVEERIVSMYAKGMTTGDIRDYMRDIYGVEVSRDLVSSITDKVLPLVSEWQSRPLAALYPIVYLDAVHFKVRDNGRIIYTTNE